MFWHKKCLYQVSFYTSPQKSTTFLPGENNDFILYTQLFILTIVLWIIKYVHTNWTVSQLIITPLFFCQTLKQIISFQTKVPLYNLSHVEVEETGNHPKFSVPTFQLITGVSWCYCVSQIHPIPSIPNPQSRQDYCHNFLKVLPTIQSLLPLIKIFSIWLDNLGLDNSLL